MIRKISNLLRNSSLMYILMSATSSTINFLTTIIYGRIFNVRTFGMINTQQAFINNVAVFMLPLQIIVCKAISEDGQDKTKSINNVFIMSSIINALIILVMIVMHTYVGKYLELNNNMEIILLILAIIINCNYLMSNGVAQGKQKFILLGISGIIFYFIKAVVSIVFSINGMNNMSVILGIITAGMSCILFVLFYCNIDLKKSVKELKISIDFKFVSTYLWTFALYIMITMFTNNGEILLANLYCDAEEIALYSVPMSLSKISVYLIATPLATMLLPKLSSIRNDSYRQIKLFGKFELITLFVSLVYGMAFCVGGKGIIYLLYGDKYSGSVRYLVPTMLFSIILGLFHVCNQYMMTNDMMKSFTVAIMVFGLIAVTIIIKIKCKIEYIPLIMSMAMILACTLTIISKYRIKNKKRTDNQ